MQFKAVFVTIATFAVGGTPAAPASSGAESEIRSFVDGKGSALFGNAGLACTVGRQQGECDQFGRCAQFIPPNENSILNQGRTVAACTAGGQTGTL